MYKKFLIAFGLVLLLLIVFNKPIREFILKMVVENIYKDSIVTTILPEEYAATNKYLVLDTRSREEYEVSHLKNAIWVGYKEFDLKQLEKFPADTPVMVYCSIGFRSKHIGEKLLANSRFSHVKNLYGGIFNWYNKDFPVYSHSGEADSIHTYSRNWSFFVVKGKKIF